MCNISHAIYSLRFVKCPHGPRDIIDSSSRNFGRSNYTNKRQQIPRISRQKFPQRRDQTRELELATTPLFRALCVIMLRTRAEFLVPEANKLFRSARVEMNRPLHILFAGAKDGKELKTNKQISFLFIFLFRRLGKKQDE